ncbi:hypothetical protein BDZ89DRAFT_1079288 [Hymenopellis radicata]|nr:hypothetical protein BDZ89DRAFT_1079288 [Hymenopellis radicata]
MAHWSPNEADEKFWLQIEVIVTLTLLIPQQREPVTPEPEARIEQRYTSNFLLAPSEPPPLIRYLPRHRHPQRHRRSSGISPPSIPSEH